MDKIHSGPLPPDLHIHTAFSRHAKGTMEETVLAAIDKGLTEIGFADHFPYPDGYEEPAPDCVIPDEETFGMYVSEVERLQRTYRDAIAIRLGVEIDYLPEYTDDIRNRLKRHRFDYAIGSIHILDGVVVDYREEVLASHLKQLGGVEGLWERYWRAFEHFLSLDLFQVVGHLDLPRKFGIAGNPDGSAETTGRVLNLIRRKGLALEVNTGGIDRASDRDVYPSRAILKRAIEQDIDIAFGSDAHRPVEVGRYFTKTAADLCALGCTRVVSFRKTRKHVYPLEPCDKW